MDIVLITGVSGSGKSVALNVLEDAGYYCVDNLPVKFLQELVSTLAQQGQPCAALAMDVRSGTFMNDLPHTLTQLRQAGHVVKFLFLDANNTTLIQRFSETRRRHPFSHRVQNQGISQATLEPTLLECIQLEREVLAGLEGLCHVIDTSGMKPNQLRQSVKDFAGAQQNSLLVTFESFAFKQGVPLDADLVFDVRSLPNPFYDPALRALTGRDQPVINFLNQAERVAEMTRDIFNFVEKWLPSYAQDSRSYLTVAIGCTGGQHRSVYCVEKISAQLKAQTLNQWQVLVRHRELN